MILENAKTINAPIEVVWAITLDIENWPRWTPTVTEVMRLDDGPFAVGSVVRIMQPGTAERGLACDRISRQQRLHLGNPRSRYANVGNPRSCRSRIRHQEHLASTSKWNCGDFTCPLNPQLGAKKSRTGKYRAQETM